MLKTVLANTISPLEMREDENCNCEEMLIRCGCNTGNVCFADALVSQLKCPDMINYDEIANYDGEAVFVIPAANWVNPNNQTICKVMLPLKEKDVKLCVIGLGIQGELNETVSDIVKKLSDDMIMALKILSEHSVSIGVRGEITASVLERLGIYNCKVIGCPSFYEPFRTMKWGGRKEVFIPEKVVCGITPGISGVHKVLELAYAAQNELVLQMMSELPYTLLENRDIEQRHIDIRFPNLKLKPDELKEYIQSKGRIFYTRKSWTEYLIKQNISFAWGTRFHGNMMAFSNGIPALWIMHDIRTKEMVEAMKLPYISWEQLMKIKKAEELFHRCKFDEEFWRHYKKLSLQYKDFLNENEVNHTFN